jgi:hypothetical protein
LILFEKFIQVSANAGRTIVISIFADGDFDVSQIIDVSANLCDFGIEFFICENLFMSVVFAPRPNDDSIWKKLSKVKIKMLLLQNSFHLLDEFLIL